MEEDVSIVIPAAGRGKRFGGELPKQYESLKDKPLLVHTLLALSPLANCLRALVVPVGAGEEEQVRALWQDFNLADHFRKTHFQVIQGGARRQDSVFAGLRCLREQGIGGIWLVHDAARPLVSSEDLFKLRNAIAENQCGAILATPSSDTLKEISSDNLHIECTLDRSKIWRALTPQGGPADLLWRAFEAAQRSDFLATDEASVMEADGQRVLLVAGSPRNIKITTPEDRELFTFLHHSR